MRKIILLASILLSLFVSANILWAGENGWNAADDIARLAREVPSIQAFETEGVVWMNSYNYFLLADGTMRKEHRYLLFLDDESDTDLDFNVIQYPMEDGASLEIVEASWFAPSGPSGPVKRGTLPVEEYEKNGIKCTFVRFPPEAMGNVVAVSSVATFPMRYYMDDALSLADRLPIWEQSVNVFLPEGMDIYWEGAGVRAPQRSRDSGVERITWNVLNQPAWKDRSIVEETRPMLLFSLQRGLISHLKNYSVMEAAFKAPAMPQTILSLKGNPSKAGEAIHKYMGERALTIEGFSPEGVRPREHILQADSWTKWERTLIAGKWLGELGYGVKVFWTQKLPINQLGPSSSALWNEPVLQITQSGAKDIFYQAGQIADFGKLTPSLYGAQVYRSEGTDIERLVLPKGSASEHSLLQTWKLSMKEDGTAEGTLDLTVSGAWVDVLGLGRTPEIEGLASQILQKIYFPVPGLQMEAKTLKALGAGYRITFDVNASIGIVSGGDTLMRLPSAAPVCFDEIPTDGRRFSFKFPFMIDRNVIIFTPRGYKPIMLPPKTEMSDSNLSLEETVAHWVPKRRVDCSSKWIVKTTVIDELSSQKIVGQLRSVLGWSQTNIPFRK